MHVSVEVVNSCGLKAADNQTDKSNWHSLMTTTLWSDEAGDGVIMQLRILECVHHPSRTNRTQDTYNGTSSDLGMKHATEQFSFILDLKDISKADEWRHMQNILTHANKQGYCESLYSLYTNSYLLVPCMQQRNNGQHCIKCRKQKCS